MKTFFVFSDENGSYKHDSSNNFKERHPFYIRVSLILDSQDWIKIANKKIFLLEKYNLPNTEEIKWSHLWSLKYLQCNKKKIPKKSNIKFLENYNYNVLIDYVEEYLNILQEIESSKIIITYTDNNICNKINEKSFLKMHIQEHVQRVEMDIQMIPSNIALFFIDPLDDKDKDNHLRQIYYDFFCQGDFFINYKHIIDTLVVEHSHRSCGIQLSDYIAGAVSSVFKSKTHTGYDRGLKIFYNSIFPKIRNNNNNSNTIPGYGLREVPKDYNVRSNYWNYILSKKELVSNFNKDPF